MITPIIKVHEEVFPIYDQGRKGKGHRRGERPLSLYTWTCVCVSVWTKEDRMRVGYEGRAWICDEEGSYAAIKPLP